MIKALTKMAPIGLIAVVFGILAFAGSPQQVEWKGKALTEGGVAVMVNPAEPQYGRIELDLEEELRIGGEGDDRTQFFRVKDVGVDRQGNIHVVDMSNGRVQVFDTDGAYIRTIGRSGQGPGEFEYPTLVRFGDGEGAVQVMDRFRRINLFDQNGQFVRSAVVAGAMIDFFAGSGSGWVAVLTRSSDEDLAATHALCRIDDQGTTQAVLAEFPYTIHMERRGGGTLSVTTGFEMSLYTASLGDDALVYGCSKDYELVVLGAGDKKQLIIRKDEPRPEFTAEEKKEFGRLPVPKLRPYHFGLLTDSEGRIYVQRNQNMIVKKGFGPMEMDDRISDVFSREGRFLFQTSLPPNTRVIKGDRIYGYFVDEDQGLEYARRFRIRNYQDLPRK